ncbi:MAG TPA: ABC transporter substrate-binding protein [Stellaceae bacterium]|nr:ABC transporter substrate-binding protein [Stellaceae bacterium]
MKRYFRGFAAATAIIAALFVWHSAAAQKRGGVLRIYSTDSPGSMLTLEQPTIVAEMPMMGVFNNLVVFDQHKPQVSLNTIVPELATSWSWNEDGTALTFTLRHGVKWHDGQPFTARDVKCSEDLRMGTAPEKLRLNFQKSALYNLAAVTTNGDYEVTYHLKQPQLAFLMLLAGGFAAIFPCHVPLARLRQHPIGTGPFKFLSFQPNEGIKLVRNPDYWKPGRPLLDGIEYTIIRDPSTAALAFIAGKFDMTFPYSLSVPLMKTIESQVPKAVCEMAPTPNNRHLLVNYHKPPFNNPQLRHAMALSIDRQAFVDILAHGQGEVGGVLQPPPAGLWGLSPDQLRKLPGYGPDVKQNRAEARAIMQKLGYGPDHHLKIKVTTRNWSIYRDPAVLLIDQLKHVYIDGILEAVDTPQFFPKILRKDYTVALNVQVGGPDPDPILKLFYGCGASLNWDGYCNPEVDKLIDEQSREGDPARRKQILWQIEQKLAADDARPIIYYRSGGTCRQPYVKGLTIMVNDTFSGWRMEDAWLDK